MTGRYLGKRPLNRRARRGLTLLESILALTIAAATMASASYSIQKSASDTKARIAGEQFAVISKAAEDYLTDNYTRIHNQIRLNGSPYLLDTDGDGESIDELVGGEYLAPSWRTGSITNPYDHSYEVWVVDDAPGDLNVGFEAVVVALGGQDTNGRQNARAAKAAGKTAGFVDPNPDLGDTDRLNGLYGGWSIDIPTFRPSASSGGDVHIGSLLHLAVETACGKGFYRREKPGCTDSSTAEVPVIFSNNLDASGSVNPDEAIGLYVENRAVLGDTGDGDQDGIRIDGNLVVNSYLELTPEQETISGVKQIPPATDANVFFYRLSSNSTIRLPDYVAPDVSGTGGTYSVDTANSLTVVVELTSSINNDEAGLDFDAAGGGSIDWGFDDGNDDPDNCTPSGGTDTMIFQFVRFSYSTEWTGQLVWQSCS